MGVNNSINDYLIKYNVIPKNPQATLGRLTSEGNHSDKQHLPLPDLGVTDSINDYLLKHNPSQRLAPQVATFNTAVNSKMDDLIIPDELKPFLEKHEAGKSSPVLNARVEENNFAGYQNPLSGSNRIFAAEEIGDFSTKEFTDYEPEIFAQINTPIGAPSRSELRSAIESSTAVYIEPYYKSDGSYVKGHYRAR